MRKECHSLPSFDTLLLHSKTNGKRSLDSFLQSPRKNKKTIFWHLIVTSETERKNDHLAPHGYAGQGMEKITLIWSPGTQERRLITLIWMEKITKACETFIVVMPGNTGTHGETFIWCLVETPQNEGKNDYLRPNCRAWGRSAKRSLDALWIRRRRNEKTIIRHLLVTPETKQENDHSTSFCSARGRM